MNRPELDKIVFKNDEYEYENWGGFSFSKEDLNTLWTIFDKYVTDGYSVTGDKEGILAGELLQELEKSDSADWDYPWMFEIAKLVLEYLTLGGLEDAISYNEIPDKLLDIVEEALEEERGDM